MIKLLWFIAIMTAEGPRSLAIPETGTFNDMAACDEFAERMKTRMPDYVRGAFHAEWDTPVGIGFKCGQPGRPA